MILHISLRVHLNPLSEVPIALFKSHLLLILLLLRRSSSFLIFRQASQIVMLLLLRIIETVAEVAAAAAVPIELLVAALEGSQVPQI